MEESARPAEADDVPRLIELARQAIAELTMLRGGEVWRRRDARREPVGDALRSAVAESGPTAGAWVVVGTIDAVPVGYGVACAEVLTDGGRLCVIQDLYVEPGAWGVGVGEVMMDSIITWARHGDCLGLDAIALPGDRGTKNFFERFGLVARAIVVHRPLRPVQAVPTPDIADGP